ncbi:hypothetical protein BABINDRAFT_5440 [Babjeviella inositovora NRRL Y-12698]|uniref:KOW domain-containing protein n=1 Tax=Babjeviella inositovora NRRL Y-12698 TaxID=984486 RepID=A0A1E3QXT2_9ASCO|nr:uncharacterized protein BABINDRAFT_5440 [Babjeviella inositovora NRRL Y-12698]ODQ82479.1 hypothetical protein BABINDRAFT_5440 [Babjeviella inositovora NRRL Y-12698]
MFGLSRTIATSVKGLQNTTRAFFDASQQVRSFTKTTGKIIPVYEPLVKLREGKPVMDAVYHHQYAILDPTGMKRKLIDASDPDHIRAGDVITVKFKNRKRGFTGLLMGISRSRTDTSLLLRNNITKLGVESRIPLFNPSVERVEVVTRNHRFRNKKSKLYFVRGTKFDVGTDLDQQLAKMKKNERW